MKTIEVQVTFTGTVAVRVPDHLNDADAKLLAGKLALSRVVATCDDPDGSEEDAACDEYQSACSKGARKRAEKDWDASTTVGVCGRWDQPDDHAGLVLKLLHEIAADSGHGLPDSALDDIVHDLASNPASDINNDGFESQIKYILRQEGPECGAATIREVIKEFSTTNRPQEQKGSP